MTIEQLLRDAVQVEPNVAAAWQRVSARLARPRRRRWQQAVAAAAACVFLALLVPAVRTTATDLLRVVMEGVTYKVIPARVITFRMDPDDITVMPDGTRVFSLDGNPPAETPLAVTAVSHPVEHFDAPPGAFPEQALAAGAIPFRVPEPLPEYPLRVGVSVVPSADGQAAHQWVSMTWETPDPTRAVLVSQRTELVREGDAWRPAPRTGGEEYIATARPEQAATVRLGNAVTALRTVDDSRVSYYFRHAGSEFFVSGALADDARLRQLAESLVR